MAERTQAQLPTLLLVLILVNWCISIVSLFVAIELLADPSGATVWLSTAALAHAPFNDYTVPGLWLLLLVGAPSLLAGFSLLLRWKLSGQVSLLAGLLVLVWCVLDGLWSGQWMWHQLVYAVGGLTQMALSMRALAHAAR